MTYQPREYALECERDVIAHIKSSVEPAVVEATVSFGKSFLIAQLARKIRDMSKKKVLVLCPSGNLVEQNREKVLAIGEPCSLFSASSNQKSLRHDIVIGTPETIKNSLSRFDDRFAAILIDEGEGLTNSVRAIAEKIKDANPLVRIIGFTGTPWRTGTGFVYRLDVDGKPMSEEQAIDPFYTQCIHRCDTHKLMDLGYLTPMVVGSVGADTYDTSHMQANKKGNFKKADIDVAYHGDGRKTSAIVADIVHNARGRNGVMIFAATVQHAREIMTSLPPELSTICVGSGPDAKQAIADFKARRKKYIVNVDKLTVGADFPHVDVIAVLRKTSSSRLLQQILGRGVRLGDASIGALPTVEQRKAAIAASEKPCCYYYDYTEDNFDTHFPDGDIWSPEIRTANPKGERIPINCTCPDCGMENEFGARPNPDEFPVDSAGYFLDLVGNRIEVEGIGPMPAHFGRRCMNFLPVGGGRLEQCQYRYTAKECPHCEAPNDIAARYCIACKGEIIDPNEKLTMEFKALKRSPRNRQCDTVLKCDVRESVSASGNETIRVDFTTPYRSFSVWYMKKPTNNLAALDYDKWLGLKGALPKTVEYKKTGSGFYHVYSFDGPIDEEPTQ